MKNEVSLSSGVGEGVMRDLRDTALEKGKGKEKSHSTAIPVCLIKRWITVRNPSVLGTVQHLDHSLSSSVYYERHCSDTSIFSFPFLGRHWILFLVP